MGSSVFPTLACRDSCAPQQRVSLAHLHDLSQPSNHGFEVHRTSSHRVPASPANSTLGTAPVRCTSALGYRRRIPEPPSRTATTPGPRTRPLRPLCPVRHHVRTRVVWRVAPTCERTSTHACPVCTCEATRYKRLQAAPYKTARASRYTVSRTPYRNLPSRTAHRATQLPGSTAP